jgi:hypothetical protein
MVGVPGVSGNEFDASVRRAVVAWVQGSAPVAELLARLELILPSPYGDQCFWGKRISELLAANNAEVEKRRAFETELVRQRISNALLRDDHDRHYARAEALSLELRRLRDGQPDGHQRPRQPGLVSSDRVPSQEGKA